MKVTVSAYVKKFDKWHAGFEAGLDGQELRNFCIYDDSPEITYETDNFGYAHIVAINGYKVDYSVKI